MTLYVAAAIAAGPLMGSFVARHPLRRSTMVLLISAATAAAWAAVLLIPGRSPLWLLAGLVVVLAIGGPGSMIGFDFARTFNPAHRIGTATGIVNVGGFIASLIAIYLIGLVLDVLYATGNSVEDHVRHRSSLRILCDVCFAELARRSRSNSSTIDMCKLLHAVAYAQDGDVLFTHQRPHIRVHMWRTFIID